MRFRDIVPCSWDNKDSPMKANRHDSNFSPMDGIDRMFHEFMRHPFGMTPWTSDRSFFATSWPRVDVTETDEAVKVTAELPGMTEKDIEVSLSDGVLSIKGEKKSERKDSDKGFYRMERSYGTFQRAIPLPAEVAEDKVEATFKNGVLTLNLPKTLAAQKKVKKIEVKAD